jgi:hypothetical protein
MVFGVELADRDIQPVWIKIENKSEDPYWLFHIQTDQDYYSPAEVAYIKRFRFSPSTNNRMRAYFESMVLPRLAPPRETVSGFIFTNMDPGLKYVNVTLAGFEGLKPFYFLCKVPGIKADYEEVDLDVLYAPGEYVDCDEQELRTALKEMPCCNGKKKRYGQRRPVEPRVHRKCGGSVDSPDGKQVGCDGEYVLGFRLADCEILTLRKTVSALARQFPVCIWTPAGGGLSKGPPGRSIKENIFACGLRHCVLRENPSGSVKSAGT